MTDVVENSIDDIRVEYVQESEEAVPPSDPDFQVLADFLTSFNFSPGADREAISVVGDADFRDMFRGAEEPEVETNFYKQRGFVDSNGDAAYPGGQLFTYQSGCDLPSYTILSRRESNCGGNFDSGFREYISVFGAKPIEVANPGDPSEAQPIIEELSWQVRKGRSYVIHQPDAATTLEIENTGSDSVDITIEDETAATSETITVAGNSTVTTVETYSDIDVIYAESEHEGDILVTDGSGTNVLDAATPLAGSDTDGVEADLGIPPLGGGSRGSAIGTDPSDYQFIGVDGPITWQGTALSDRIHTLDLTVSIETAREAIQGTRGSTIDPGMRTAEVEADTSGPHETADLIAENFHNESGNVVYPYPDNDVTVYNAEIIDVPDLTRDAGDENYIPSTTWQGHSDDTNPAVDATYTGA